MELDDKISKLQEENIALQKRLDRMRHIMRMAIDSFTKYLADTGQIDEQTIEAFEKLKDAVDNF